MFEGLFSQDTRPAVSLRGFDGKPTEMTHEQLSQLNPLQMEQLRQNNTDNQETQNILGNYMHRVMNRYITNENPAMGTVMAGLEGPYALAKGAAKSLPQGMRGSMFGQARSQPSMEQVYQGMMGTGEGYADTIRKAIKDISGLQSPEDALNSILVKEKAGTLPSDTASKLREQVPQDKTEFKNWKDSTLQSLVNRLGK